MRLVPTVVAAACIVVLVAAILYSKSQDALSLSRPGDDKVSTIAVNDHGQTLVEVSYGHQGLRSPPCGWLGAWMKENKDAKIVSVTSVDRGAYGATSSFLVVFERKAEKQK